MGLKVSPGALHPRRIVMRSTGAGRRIVIRPSASGGSGGGVTDHGALTGLGDDDHPQYALADGTRGAFATTAQGDLADTAVQPSALSDAITAHTAATDPHGDRAYTDAQIIASLANFVAGAPGILDTWLEMVTAIQADQTGLAALTTVVAGKLAKASNLSDLADIPTARTNLGLGSAATTAASAYDAAGTAAAAQAAAIAAAATDATTKADAKVADAINDGVTTVAPSQNAVFDALASKIANPGGSNDDFLQRKAGVYTNRTIAQVKADLGIGGVATDAIFDAKGDLPVGTGADAAAKLTVGADGSSLTADSSAAAGVAWLGAVSIKAPKTAGGGIHTPETTPPSSSAPQTAANAQVATWFPCWVHKPVRPLLRSYCFTPEAGSSARFALWTLDHATIMPGTLIEDLGLMAGTSTGAKALSASTATVTGWFFLAVWASNHTTVRWGRPTFDSSKCQMFGTMAVAWGRSQYGWRAAGVDYSSAWNSTLPTLEAASDVDHGNPILPYWEYT